MVSRIKRSLSDLKLNVKIRLYLSIIIIFFCITFFLVFTTLIKYNREYNRIMQSATKASSFSIDYKKDLDYKMYQIIIGSMSFAEGNPYEDIRAGLEIAAELKRAAGTKICKDRAVSIEKYLGNLMSYVETIEENLIETGHYTENMEKLKYDIRITTSLVQEAVLEYIYYATMDMEQVRSEMEAQMTKSLELAVLLVGALAIGALFFSVIVSNSISKPIKQLGDITNQVAKGDLSVRSDIKSGAEVKVLSDSLNIMIVKLSNLIETVKIEQSNLREAELNLLQEQINPHFLYNTLDTIIWLAETGKSDTIVDIVSSLSNYFRTSLSKGNNMITLKEEELHVKSYLQIQQHRYGDILDYEIDIPKEYSLCSIPKITLQPLVENALYHGIKNKRGKGKILITGKQQGNRLLLTVTDNGMGMTEERLRQVLEGMEPQEDHPKEFFGLYNVNERIHLYYGYEYGIRIRSIHQVGTEVEVSIPYQTSLETDCSQGQMNSETVVNY